MTISKMAISMGDPNGIGPEIIVKAFKGGALHDCLVIGDPGRLAEAGERIGTKVRIERAPAVTTPLSDDRLTVLAVGPDFAGRPFGVVGAEAGSASFDYVDKGIDAALKGSVDALVTAPIHKEAWSDAKIPFPGHTELLSDRAGVPVAMMLANPELRVVLATIHVSLREACDLITLDRELEAIRQADQAGRALGYEAPRVAVAGLNPHAGEGGLFGREEVEIIGPAIETARREGIDVTGPWSGDTVFARARKGEFDVVVAQTHDQGLIPVKYLGIEDGVNVTVGLPFVRTSPDHGTAFDIAGSGSADPASLVAAITMARQLVDARSRRSAA